MEPTSPIYDQPAQCFIDDDAEEALTRPALLLFAAGMIGLGVLALIFGDFALVWQPVPQWVPGRTGLAYMAGLLMLLGGVGLLFRSTAAWSIRILLPYLILWSLLKLPPLIASPQHEFVWLGFGELAMLVAGGWLLFARFAELAGRRHFAQFSGEKGLRIARILFGASVIPVGLSHIVYLTATAEFVPAFLPYRTLWAVLTGVGQIVCGAGVLLSPYPGLAAAAEAVMLSLFTFLVWLPAIFASPSARLPWTAFFISWAISAAAWALASGLRNHK